MICGDCGKPASIRFVEMVDGELRTLTLCDDCASTRGMALSLAPLAGPLVNMLMGLLEEMKGEPDETASEPACPDCGLTYAEFRRSGKLGCAGCYEALSSELRPLLRRVHGSTQHVGTIPSHAPPGIELDRQARSLRLELERAVRAEDYERAAELRDRVRALAAEGAADSAAGLRDAQGPPRDAPRPSDHGGDDVDA